MFSPGMYLQEFLCGMNPTTGILGPSILIITVQSGSISLYLCLKYTRMLSVSHSFPHLLSTGPRMVSCYGQNVHFPDINDVDHVFIRLLGTFSSFSVKRLFQYFVHLSIGFVVFPYWFVRTLYVVKTLSFTRYMYCTYLLSVCGLLCHSIWYLFKK